MCSAHMQKLQLPLLMSSHQTAQKLDNYLLWEDVTAQCSREQAGNNCSTHQRLHCAQRFRTPFNAPAWCRQNYWRHFQETKPAAHPVDLDKETSIGKPLKCT